VKPKVTLYSKRAFTLTEVTLAIGVVTFGLVGIFSILPFGLTAQKDNREETIIRYEAQFWNEALLANGLVLEDLERVSKVDVHKNDQNDIDKYFPGVNEKSTTWSPFVCGSLLKPVEDNATDKNGSFARVKAINGTLLDNLCGADVNSPLYEFSLGYILQVQPVRVPSKNTIGSDRNGSKIIMTFYWPIFEEVADALDTNNIKQVVHASQSGSPLTPSGVNVPRMKSKKFTIRVPHKLKLVESGENLTHTPAFLATLSPVEKQKFWRQNRFLETFKDYSVGQRVTVEDLEERFPVIRSNDPKYYSSPRRVNFNAALGISFTADINFPNTPPNYADVKRAYKDKAMASKIGITFLPDDLGLGKPGFQGLYLRDSKYQFFQIARVGGVHGPLSFMSNASTIATGNYAITFLSRYDETWADVLEELAQPVKGLQAPLYKESRGVYRLDKIFKSSTWDPNRPTGPKLYYLSETK
jgi:hypothetical protein